MRKIKPFEQLKFYDDFMFGLVMQDRDICSRAFDPFKKGIPCYTVRRMCAENTGIDIEDAATAYIFNCTAYSKTSNADLGAFLKFVQTGTAESELTRRINDMVESKKKIEANQKMYLTWSLHDHDVRNEGRREGERIGRKETKIENARNFLAMGLGSHEQIAKGVGLPIEKIEELATELATSQSK